MSDMVAIVLKMTLGLFVKKARGSLSKKLKDGGLNSQQLRSLIMSKLEDVKTKLVGLARGNLLSSASFIQEGLGILDDLLDKPNSPTLPPQGDDDKVGENSSGACSSDQASLSGNDSPLNVDSALKVAEAINQMKISSTDHFTAAMELFKNANTEATKAFHNESLSLEDRILAAKLRVQSRLLLSLENPSLASQPCRLYLEELHGVASIVEDVRSYLEGGVLSFLNKEKRHELVLSVSAINFVVFNFLRSFTKGPINVYDWPNLKRGDWTYNPLIPDRTICMELRSVGIEFPNLVVFKDVGLKMLFNLETVVLNSNGDLFITEGNKTLWKITKGKHTKYFENESVYLVAIDYDDITHVLTTVDDDFEGTPSDTISSPLYCMMAVIDPLLTTVIGLDRHGRESWGCSKAIKSTLNGFAIVSCNHPSSCKVAFYKSNKGIIKYTHSFQISLWESSLTTVTNKYQVVAVEKRGYRVRVYENDGQLIREFELCGGERESCVSIAFNFLTEELVVVSRVGSWYFLSTYEPKTGKRRHNVRLTLFGKVKEKTYLHLTTHCSGPMALVSCEYVLYLQ